MGVSGRLPRKLAVILHADVVGSTELVRRDEALAHERIQDAFARLSTAIAAYGGIAHEVRGDALVAEFDRASDAVCAALDFQVRNTQFHTTLYDTVQPELRIGIALGEVIIDDHTLTGEGVVLAQRLEQLARAGAVCIQGSVYEAVPGRLPFDYEDLGEQEVKGFPKPVRAYAVTPKTGEAIPAPERDPEPAATPTKRLPKHGIAGSVIALAIIVGVVAWLTPWKLTEEETASIEKMAFPLPDKPSIAVLPFTNMSGVAEQDYFVDGITENLITDLSKISGLFVVARNSSFSYKGQQVKVQQVAEDLGVRYVMEGSVQRAGNQVRINAQLVDATTGGHLWAERYDGSLQDIFALQDQVTRKIVSALEISLTGDEAAQQAQHSTDNPEAHDAFLQGWAYYKLGSRADLVRSIPFLEEAVRLDPDYADAHAVLATIYWNALDRDWVFDLGIPSFEVEDRARHHQQEALKTPNLLSHAQQSRIYLAQGLADEALREAEKAVALDPNGASAYAALANILILVDRPLEGLDAIRKAIRLDPYHPPQYLTMLGAAQFGLEQFEAAATSFERAIKRDPDSERSLIYLASSYGHLGDLSKAEVAIEAANELRATNAQSALNLESNMIDGCSPIENGFDFPRFGPLQSQDRLRLGLSKIPALKWPYLTIGSTSGASAKTFDSAMGEWSAIFQGPDCILNIVPMIIVDETKAITPSYRNGRIFFYAIDDQRKWEGYWVDEIAGQCAEKKDGSTYWGVLTIQFNDTYTQWKGAFDICGVGRKYPWNGVRL